MDANKNTNNGAVQVAAINQSSKPEYLRVPDAVRIFAICRSSLYELIGEGRIKSVCLRKRGAIRGIRLISYDSLLAYIENAADVGRAQ